MTSYFEEEFNKFKQSNTNHSIHVTYEKFIIKINEKTWIFNKKDFDTRLLDYMDRDLGKCQYCKDYCNKWFLIIRKKIE